MARSISVCRMVATLSVMITESVSSPIARPSGEDLGTCTLLGWPARDMLLVIIATIVCGSPVFKLSGMMTSAGRRFAVRRFESGNRTSTTSPSLKGIVRVHFGALPIFLERLQPCAQVLGLLRADMPLSKINRSIGRQKCHDHARLVRRGSGFEEFDFAVTVNAFD